MNKMTAEEIIEVISKEDESFFAYNGKYEGLGLSPIVDTKGDVSGGGEDSRVVRHFVDHDIHIMITGFYSSYNGTDWDEGYTEVKPVLKTITIFE